MSHSSNDNNNNRNAANETSIHHNLALFWFLFTR